MVGRNLHSMWPPTMKADPDVRSFEQLEVRGVMEVELGTSILRVPLAFALRRIPNYLRDRAGETHYIPRTHGMEGEECGGTPKEEVQGKDKYTVQRAYVAEGEGSGVARATEEPAARVMGC